MFIPGKGCSKSPQADEHQPKRLGACDWCASATYQRDCLGKRAVSADTALRLARAFGTIEQFWMGLQTDYDLEQARKAAANEIRKIRSLAA